MEFPETFDEFVDSYGFIDTEEVYTNGSQLISVFRVKQWLKHISEKTQMIDKSNFDEEQYKTDLQSAYDCGYNKALSENKRDLISRQAVIDLVSKFIVKIISVGGRDLNAHTNDVLRQIVRNISSDRVLPSVENKGEWVKIQSGDKDFPESIVCSKCKNENSHLDFNEHKEPIGKVFVTSKFCPNCGADMRKPKDIIHKAIDNTIFAEEAYPNIKEELHKAVDMRGE